MRNFYELTQAMAKRKALLIVSALLVFMGIRYLYNCRHSDFEAIAAVVIEKHSTEEGVSLLPSFAKGITSQPVMEQVVSRLGLVSKNMPLEIVQKKINDMQTAVSIWEEKDSGIFYIQFHDKDPEFAVRAVNTIAQQFQTSKDPAKANSSQSRRDFFERQIQTLQNQVTALENQIKEIREKGGQRGAVAALESEILARRAERNALLEKYTEKHPEILKLDEELKRLEDRLHGMSFQEKELSQLEEQLAEADQKYRTARQEFDDSQLGIAEESKGVRVLSLASHAKKSLGIECRPDLVGVSVLLGLLAGVLAVFFLERSGPSY